MDARALTRRISEWFFRPAALREARRALPAAGASRAAAARQAKLVLEVARRTAEPAEALTATTFAQYQKQIKPQPGESRWMEIPWQHSLWTAREMAAKEGKPIFLWFGSGGSPACHT